MECSPTNNNETRHAMRRKTRKWVIYSNDTVGDHVLEPVSIESSQDNSEIIVVQTW